MKFCKYQKKDMEVLECIHPRTLAKKAHTGLVYSCSKNISNLKLMKFGNLYRIYCQGCSAFEPIEGLHNTIYMYGEDLRFNKRMFYLIEEKHNYRIIRTDTIDAESLKLVIDDEDQDSSSST